MRFIADVSDPSLQDLVEMREVFLSREFPADTSFLVILSAYIRVRQKKIAKLEEAFGDSFTT